MILAITFLVYVFGHEHPPKNEVTDSTFLASARFDSSSVTVRAATSGLRDHLERYLHEVEGDLLITLELVNMDSASRLISVHQTPLSDQEVSSNFFGTDDHFFHTGIIREDVGEFDEFILLEEQRRGLRSVRAPPLLDGPRHRRREGRRRRRRVEAAAGLRRQPRRRRIR